MIDVNYYKPQYKTAESRALYLVARKAYGSFKKMANVFGVERQYISQWVKLGTPVKFAGYLGRKHGFPPALLNFDSYVSLVWIPEENNIYPVLVEYSDFFNADDRKYILAGSFVKDVNKATKLKDKEIVK